MPLSNHLIAALKSLRSFVESIFALIEQTEKYEYGKLKIWYNRRRSGSTSSNSGMRVNYVTSVGMTMIMIILLLLLLFVIVARFHWLYSNLHVNFHFVLVQY